MKKLLFILAFVGALHAQTSSPTFQYVDSAPSGNCPTTPTPPIQIVYSTGVAYSCNSGVWGAFGSGAAGTLPIPTAANQAPVSTAPGSAYLAMGVLLSGGNLNSTQTAQTPTYFPSVGTMLQVDGFPINGGQFRGAWNNSTTYNRFDTVTSGGVDWIAANGSVNVNPAEGAAGASQFWFQFDATGAGAAATQADSAYFWAKEQVQVHATGFGAYSSVGLHFGSRVGGYAKNGDWTMPTNTFGYTVSLFGDGRGQTRVYQTSSTLQYMVVSPNVNSSGGQTINGITLDANLLAGGCLSHHLRRSLINDVVCWNPQEQPGGTIGAAMWLGSGADAYESMYSHLLVRSPTYNGILPAIGTATVTAGAITGITYTNTGTNLDLPVTAGPGLVAYFIGKGATSSSWKPCGTMPVVSAIALTGGSINTGTGIGGITFSGAGSTCGGTIYVRIQQAGTLLQGFYFNGSDTTADDIVTSGDFKAECEFVNGPVLLSHEHPYCAAPYQIEATGGYQDHIAPQLDSPIQYGFYMGGTGGTVIHAPVTEFNAGSEFGAGDFLVDAASGTITIEGSGCYPGSPQNFGGYTKFTGTAVGPMTPSNFAPGSTSFISGAQQNCDGTGTLWGTYPAGGGGLPTATTAGQVPVYTGAGTTAAAGFTSPAGSTIYLANYLANPSVPAQVRWDCSWSVGSSPRTITCPSGTFTSSMTGWVAWATQLNPGGNAEVANNFACGTAGTNATLTFVNSTTATINTACSVVPGSSTNGGSAFIFGPDETAGVDSWITAVANACGTGVLPTGYVLTSHGGGGWNMTAAQNTNCGNATGVHTGGAVITGAGITRSTIGIEPAFDFTTCNGGPTSNTCFGSAKTNASGILVGGYSFHDFSISGFGSTLDSSTQVNWVEMLYGNYANNFAITKLGGTLVSHTVGIKLNGSFGQFWNLISDWAGAIPCWVTNGLPYAPNVMGGSSECVGGSGAAVSGVGSSYGVLISTGGWLVSHGSTFAGGDTDNVSSDVAISGGTYESYGDSVCCTNTGTVMAMLSFDSNGGTATIDGFSGFITNMGNGSHFISTASSGSPSISVRNSNISIGGGSGQQCYVIQSGTFTDGGNNKCTGASSASAFPSWTYTGPLNLAQCAGCFTGSNSTTWPPSATGPTFSPAAGSISSGTTVTATCSGGSPFVSTGTTAVAGGTGIALSSSGTLYGSCQGSGYFTTSSAAYTVTGGTITYVNTVFNEAGSGGLVGTTPATCASGCVGPWALIGTDVFAYTGSSSVTSTTGNTGNLDYIDAGATTVVVRFNLSACAGNCQFIFRDSGGNNYIAMNCTTASGGSCQMYDGPGFGTIGAAVTGTVTGAYAITLTGSSVSLTTPNGTSSGTTGNTTGTAYGFDLQPSSSVMTLTAYSVKSN